MTDRGSPKMVRLRRRSFLAGAAAAAVLPSVAGSAPSPLVKTIPSTGRRIPAIGMGTWITFNVGPIPPIRAARVEVLRAFFAAGGGMVDSSPMYGSAEEVMGHCLGALGRPAGLFSATKVWTSDPAGGRAQAAESERLWGLDRFDLQQVHNLVGLESHLPMLRDLQAAGRVGHVGVTTSHGRRHGDLAALLAREPLDFVQLTYNVLDREVEDRLLPLAADRGVAVIANRPFRRGALTERLAGAPLPGWAAEIGVTTWAQALLKWIVAHPAVTVAIPATSRVDHMRENMAAGQGPMPDAGLRARIIRDAEALL